MKNCHAKNIFSILGTIAICVCLALCVLACVLLPLSVAQADSSMNVIVAPVSNLEGNANAGASSIKLAINSFEFYIPESYYLTNLRSAFGNYYSVSYCGFDFYFESETTPQTTAVTFQDGVSPYPDILLTVKEGATLSTSGVTSEHTIRFLGFATDDSSNIFVVATKDGNSVFSFESKDSFNEFTVAYHPIAQAERDRILDSKKPVEPSGGDIVPNTSLALRIVLIIGICVPAVIIAVLLFKPSKNDRSQGKSVMRRHRGKNDFDYDSTRSYNPDGYDDRPRYDEQGRPIYDGRNGYDRNYRDNRNDYPNQNGNPNDRNDDHRR